MLLFALLTTTLSSCIKDRLFEGQHGAPMPGGGTVTGALKINEYVAAGSNNANEYGTTEDWFEIYNPNATPMVLQAGEWFVSDDMANEEKYELPQLTIAARGFLVIWCDGLNTMGTQVHTNFSLSSAGEDILIHHTTNTVSENVDAVTFPAQDGTGSSLGRTPDGAETWVTFTTPTPGASNQ